MLQYRLRLIVLSSALGIQSCVVPAQSASGSVDDEDVAVQQGAVQFSYQSYFQIRQGANFDSVDKAVGVMRNLSIPGQSGVKSSCGITFLSKHIGLTSAHCIDKDQYPDITTANITVQQFDTSAGLTNTTIWNQAQIQGSWPSWSQTGVGCSSGYCVTYSDSACKIVMRCHRDYGLENCPASLVALNGGNGTDLALVRCQNRPANLQANWVSVRTNDDAVGDNVEVRWYHEIVNTATSPTDSIPSYPANSWAHYGLYNGLDSGTSGKTDNYHYVKGSSLQFFPLGSLTWSNGTTKYKAVALGTGLQSDQMKSDAFICHGTSGSSYFMAGTSFVHGPASLILNETRLCVDAANHSPGQFVSGYVRPKHVRVLEALSMIQTDR